jgi:carbon storage regulator
MLFLTRKVGESIVINDNIELTVVEVRGKSIKLGFTFPPEAKVLRRELHDRIKADGVKAESGVRKTDAADDIGSETEIPTVS